MATDTTTDADIWDALRLTYKDLARLPHGLSDRVLDAQIAKVLRWAVNTLRQESAQAKSDLLPALSDQDVLSQDELARRLGAEAAVAVFTAVADVFHRILEADRGR